MWPLIDPPDTRVVYTGLVMLVAAMRLVELRISRRHIARLQARGAVEVGSEHYPWMVAVHASFLIACPLEVWLLSRPWMPALALAMLTLLLLAAGIRLWVIATLGDRWTTRVFHLPDEPLATTGPYRWIRHPNYLGVAVEFLALPMVHTAWLTAVVFGAANAMILFRRIRVEDEALRGDEESGGGSTMISERP